MGRTTIVTCAALAGIAGDRALAHASPRSDPTAGRAVFTGATLASPTSISLNPAALGPGRVPREATFALAMFRIAGRGGPIDRPEGARLLGEAVKLGHVVAAYDLALLHLEGQIVRPDLARAAELMRRAADAGSPEAQYALATFYKEGRGVTKDLNEAARLLGLAARSGHTDSEVEYAIALFNGTGIAKNESAAGGYFLKAAQKNNPVAQNRLAWMYATGRGIKAEPVEAARWHLIAKAGGVDDQPLDELIRKMNPTDRAMGENKAKPWIARMNAAGPAPFPTPPAHTIKSQRVKP